MKVSGNVAVKKGEKKVAKVPIVESEDSQAGNLIEKDFQRSRIKKKVTITEKDLKKEDKQKWLVPEEVQESFITKPNVIKQESMDEESSQEDDGNMIKETKNQGRQLSDSNKHILLSQQNEFPENESKVQLLSEGNEKLSNKFSLQIKESEPSEKDLNEILKTDLYNNEEESSEPLVIKYSKISQPNVKEPDPENSPAGS